MKYRVTFPYIPDMGTVEPMIASSSPMETWRENALWHLNSMRDHDGLRKLDSLPKGTKAEPLQEIGR